jgi:hypothetical protein
MRSPRIVTLHKYYEDEQIKEDEMGGKCITNGKDINS